jgi:hypothetical protein
MDTFATFFMKRLWDLLRAVTWWSGAVDIMNRSDLVTVHTLRSIKDLATSFKLDFKKYAGVWGTQFLGHNSLPRLVCDAFNKSVAVWPRILCTTN